MHSTTFPTTAMAMRRMAWRSIPRQYNNTLSQTALFSTRTSIYNQFQRVPPQRPGSAAPVIQNPFYPAFSFRGLGAGRKAKIFVIACLTVFGTIESVFWVKVVWAKFSPSPADDGRKPEGN